MYYLANIITKSIYRQNSLGQQRRDWLTAPANFEGPSVGCKPFFIERKTSGSGDRCVELSDGDMIFFDAKSFFIRSSVDLASFDSSSD